MIEQVETRSKIEVDEAGIYKYWQLELEAASKAEEDYRKESDDLIKRYSGEVKLDFNILWANVEVLKPVVYSNSAKPDVRRRFTSIDPVGRQISLLIERAILYSCEVSGFDSQIEAVRDEMLITGRGVSWVEYKPELASAEEGAELHITKQTLAVKYINYADYRVSPATCWNDVRWVARRHTPNRDELVAQFGEEIGNAIPLNASTIASESLKEAGEISHLFKRGEVWEIWDKQKRQRVWIAQGFSRPALIEDDPYGLEHFFPCPEPLYAFKTPDSMRPRAEYEIYRKQVEVLNETSRRITSLTKQLKIKGIYNAVHAAAVDAMRSASDGDFVPVTTPDINASMNDMVAYWPIEKIIQVVATLYQARDQQLQTIYQITGLSDIVRGSTSASETATAQQLKGNFATMRMEPRQKPIQIMIRDLFRIKAELIAEHFTPETLQQITQIEVTPDMLAIMRNDKLRGYRIGIETDSTVQADADADKQRRIEFMTAFSETVEKLAPMIQGGFMDIETGKAMLNFVARGFKTGRELEEAIEAMGQGLGQQEQPPEQPPQPDPQMLKLELEREIGHKKLETDRELGLAKIASDRDTKITMAQITSKPNTQVQFDASGALGGVSEMIAGAMQVVAQNSAQQANDNQQFMAMMAQNQNNLAQIQASQGEQLAQAMAGMAEAVAALAETAQKPTTKTINAPRGADGRIDFNRVTVVESL